MSDIDERAFLVSASEDGHERRLFVSYASADVAVADDIVRELELAGVSCWIAPRNIPAGTDYGSEIIPAIRSASALLFIYSESANQSKHCLREVETAVTYGVNILPVRLDATPMAAGLEYRLSTVQWIDWSSADALRVIASAAAFGNTPGNSREPTSVPDVPLRRASIADVGEIVGREREAEALTSMLEVVSGSGSGRMMLIRGESGVGKSALVAHVAVTAVASGFRVLATTCGSFLDGVSFFPVREILRQLTDSSNDLLAYAKRLYGSTSQQASMAAIIDSALVDAVARREALLATFAALVLGTANQRSGQPLLLFIDDMENIDSGSVDGLLCLLARLGDGPVFVVGAFRSDVVDLASRSHPLTSLIDAIRRNQRTASIIDIPALPKASYAAVIAAMLGGPTRLPTNVIEYLWAETEGNVLFLREIVRALSLETTTSTRPCFVNEDGIWRFRGAVEELSTPRSVEEAIERNLEAVADADRGYLEAAAVIGKQFRFDIALGISGTEDEDLLDALERCVAQSILHELSEPIDSFEFSHNKVRDVLYNSLSQIRRRRIHSKVADILIASPTGFSDSLIGEHLYRADRFAEAVGYLYRSAVALMDVQESERAVDQLMRVRAILDQGEAMDGLDEVDIGLLLLQALQDSSQYAECESLAHDITALPDIDDERRGRAYDSLGDLERARGRIVEALLAYEQAERLSAGSPELELEVCADLHELHDRQRERSAGVDNDASKHHGETAEAYLDREVSLAERVGSPTDRARAYRNRAKSLRRVGKVDAALAMYERSLAQTDVRVASHQILISYAKTLRFAGRSDDARAVIQKVYDWSIQTGARRSEAIALYYRAMIDMDLQIASQAAWRDLGDALATHQEIGYDRGLWEVHLLRGEWFSQHQEWADALSEFRAAIGMKGLDDDAVVAAVRAQLDATDEHARADRIDQLWSNREP